MTLSAPAAGVGAALAGCLIASACAVGHTKALEPALNEFERAQRALSLSRPADSAYALKEFSLAGELYAAAANDWIDPSFYYDAACSYALAGDSIDAFHQLRLTIRQGWRDTPMLQRDKDLTSLRRSTQWPGIVAGSDENLRRYRTEHGDPARAQFVASDIPHFWAALDATARRPELAGRAEAYRELYFDPGSPGLTDYFYIKIRTLAQFVENVNRRAPYYASLREASQTIPSHFGAMRQAFQRLKELYPDAVFPDVYFLVGRENSAGTVSLRGLLLGVEHGPFAPRAEAPSPRDWLPNMEFLPYIVAHEVVHVQQKSGPHTLLRDALIEGGADFIGELISGRQTNPGAHEFGDAHEAEVWRRFAHDMHGTDDQDWIANAGSDRVGPTWAPDLGYYVGYQIAKAYYDHAADKRAAIRDLLALDDPDAILRASGYATRFGG